MGNTLTIVNHSKHLLSYVCTYQISGQTSSFGKLGAGKYVDVCHEYSIPCYLYIKMTDCDERECCHYPDYKWSYNPIRKPEYIVEEQALSRGDNEPASWLLDGKNTVTEDIKATGKKYLYKILERKHEPIIEDLEVYFSHEQAEEMPIHGRVNTEIKGEQWEEVLLGRSRELALSLQEKELSEEKLQEIFSGLWDSCGINGEIVVPVPSFYQEKLEEFKAVSNVASLISDSSLWANLPEKFTEYLSTKSEKLSADEKKKVEEVTQGIEKRVKEFTDRKREEKKENETNYYEEVSSLIRVEISSKLHSDFPFPNEFLVFVPMYLCHRVAHSFAQISNDFNKSIDPAVYLGMKKEEFLQSFKYFYGRTK